MSFIGNTPTQQAFVPAIDYFSGNGSTVEFTLSRPVASVAQVRVTVNNVAQNPSTAFTVLNSTITFTGAPSTGTNNIYVEYTSPITQVMQPSQATVGTLQLVDAAVTAAKIADANITAAKLAAGQVLSLNGVTFPAIQSASSDANTLDDYEEGTWTPAFSVGGITGTSITYSGKYTKIGRVVIVTMEAYSASGNLNISSYAGFSGLPFAVGTYGQGSIASEDIDVFASLGFCTAGASSLYLSKCGNGTSSNLFVTCTYVV